MDFTPVIVVIGRLRFARTWAALVLHALLAAFWQPLALALFLAGWLLILGALGGNFYLALSGAALNLAAFFWALALGIRRLVWPRTPDVLRHLELSNNLKNRPLRGLADEVAQAQVVSSRLLWHRHMKALAGNLGPLSFHWPAPVLARLDPLALRHGALLVFLVGLAMSQGPFFGRLTDAFKGGMPGAGHNRTVSLDAWIEPPDYTRLPPVILNRLGEGEEAAPRNDLRSDLARRQANLVVVPDGSEMVLRVNHAAEAPRLVTPDAGELDFTREGEGQYVFKGKLSADGEYSVSHDGDDLAKWPVRVMPDHPPEISFKGPVQITLRDTVLVSYLAQDDYGVTDVILRLRLVGHPDGATQEFALPAGFGDRAVLDSSHYLDLTPHPWAGLHVTAVLVAVDDRDQRGESPAMPILLPQRIFTHPVARAIIEQRRRLAAGQAAPTEVADALRTIGWQADAYGSDMTVFLALSVSVARLHHHDVVSEIPSVLDLLWKIALRLEDGGVSLAAQDLEAAEKALLQALEDGADQETLDRLMNQMEEAMSRYLEALAEKMEQMEEPDGLREVPDNQMVTGESLKDMMDKIRELLRMGMVDEAQKMLAELREMMQNLRAAPSPFAAGEGKQALEMLKDLYDLMDDQQDLMEQTHDRAMGREDQNSKAGDGQSGEMSPQEQAARQDQLRRSLESLGERIGDMLGDVPPSMGEAGQSMGEAADALGEGRTHRATQSQGKALNQMQESAKAVQDAIIERFGSGGSSPQVMQGENDGSGRDPFGRVPNAGNQGNGAGETAIPDATDIERARQIRDELRRRSGDRNRPPVERDYIDRLLKPF